MEKMENSQYPSRLVIVLFRKVGNSQGFPAFDFGLYTEIQNSENS